MKMPRDRNDRVLMVAVSALVGLGLAVGDPLAHPDRQRRIASDLPSEFVRHVQSAPLRDDPIHQP